MTFLIGSDEVGLGAWAGPLVVCAVAVPTLWVPPTGLNDSKQLTPRQRSDLYAKLRAVVPEEDIAVFYADNTTIDSQGIRRVLIDAHTKAIQVVLARHPETDIVVDGIVRLRQLPQARCVPKADATFPVVMAASIIAKVHRDMLMQLHHRQFPQYQWISNVGYGTQQHRDGLAKHGVSPLHRKSYRPISDLVKAVTK